MPLRFSTNWTLCVWGVQRYGKRLCATGRRGRRRPHYGELDQWARAVPASARAGCRWRTGLLLFPPGLEFLAALFGCSVSVVACQLPSAAQPATTGFRPLPSAPGHIGADDGTGVRIGKPASLHSGAEVSALAISTEPI